MTPTIREQAEWLHVANGGQIDRYDICVNCGEPMLYRCGQRLTGIFVEESFCQNSKCPAFLVEIAEE